MDKLEMLYEKLSCSNIEYYLEQDENFIKNIEWLIEFLLEHHVLPQQECFPYSGEQVMDWYKSLDETNEVYNALKQATFEIMMTPKPKLVWYRKWHAFKEYVDKCHCIPLRGEASFYDGKDMSSWFSTQKYCLHYPDKTNCNPFTLFQKKLVQSLIDAEHMIKHPYVSHKDLLNQLYKAILHNDMKEIYSLQVKLNYGKNLKQEGEQQIYKNLMNLQMRIKRDGIKSIVKYTGKKLSKDCSIAASPKIKNSTFGEKILLQEKAVFPKKSNGYYVTYLQQMLGYDTEEMGKLLHCTADYYRHLKSNAFSLTFSKKMILVCFASAFKEDPILAEMIRKFNNEVTFQDDINCFIQTLVASFSIYLEKKDLQIQQFCKKYCVTKDVIPVHKYSDCKKIEIYIDLNFLLLCNISKEEKQVILALQQILKNDVLKSISGKDILSKVFMLLNIPFYDRKSVYTLSKEEAISLLEQFELIKLENEDTFLIERAKDLLTFAIYPGVNLAYELLRYKEMNGMETQEISALFSFNRCYISAMFVTGDIPESVKKNVMRYIYENDLNGEEPVVSRFRKSFLGNIPKLKLEKDVKNF